jgi:hypothetical protein
MQAFPHTLKLFSAALTLAGFCFIGSVRAGTEVKPVGIFRSENQIYALFDIFASYAPAPTHFYTTLRLAAGEHYSISDKISLTLSRIEPEKGLIHFDFGGTNLSSEIKPRLPSGRSAVAFDSASVDQLLAIYSISSKTNVLPHRDLPSAKFTFAADLSDTPSAAKLLREQLAGGEIALVPFSNSFEAVVPGKMIGAKFDRSRYLKPKIAAERETGTLELHATPFIQVLEICAGILNLEAPPRPQSLNFDSALRHEIRLVEAASAEEVADALQLLLQWEGFRLVQDQAGKISVVSDK